MLAPLVILGIAAALATLGLYALSGAGKLRRLPFVRFVLGAASCVFILRALALPAVLFVAPAARSQLSLFEIVTAVLCFLLGLAFLSGVYGQTQTRMA